MTVFLIFLQLGFTSFGGPVAHISYLRRAFVEKRCWLDESEFADWVALCQFLPGPASSQLVFALGMRRAGWMGGFAASVGFTLPSAILMIGLSIWLGGTPMLLLSGWVHGLKLAAVAVVAHAVWNMGRSLCPDGLRRVVAGMSAGLVLAYPGFFAQTTVLLLGALACWCWLKRTPNRSVITETHASIPSQRSGAVAFGLFFVVLGSLPILATALDAKVMRVFDGFYRAGASVFGGGHVVLPMLRSVVVPPGWVSDGVFLAGYGAAQALPGPLFAFAGFLGASMVSGIEAWAYGMLCLLAVFLPAWLLIAGALPFWHRWRSRSWTQAAMAGANAATVGVLLAALCNPLAVEALRSPADACVVVLGFACLTITRVSPLTVVATSALIGLWLG